ANVLDVLAQIFEHARAAVGLAARLEGRLDAHFELFAHDVAMLESREERPGKRWSGSLGRCDSPELRTGNDATPVQLRRVHALVIDDFGCRANAESKDDIGLVDVFGAVERVVELERARVPDWPAGAEI